MFLELLAGGDPPPSGFQRIHTEDVCVCIMNGMEVALHDPIAIRLLDDPTQSLSIASLPAFLSMKAIALQRREVQKRAKDAYDIVYCLRNYPGGTEAAAKEFKVALSNPIVASAAALLKELFATTDSIGPVAYAEDVGDIEEASLKRREAFERVNDLLRRIEG